MTQNTKDRLLLGSVFVFIFLGLLVKMDYRLNKAPEIGAIYYAYLKNPDPFAKPIDWEVKVLDTKNGWVKYQWLTNGPISTAKFSWFNQVYTKLQTRPLENNP